MPPHRPLACLAVIVCLLAACEAPPPAAPGPTATAAEAGPVVTTPNTRTATLSEIKKAVDSRPAGTDAWMGAAEGDQVTGGGGVRTGEEARVRLEISDGTIIRLAANTVFELMELSPEPDDPITRLQVDAGQVWVWVTKTLGAGSFEVETPNGVATVRGSLMSVAFDPATGRMAVTCAEGTCTLADRARQTVETLSAGQQTEIPGLGLAPGRARRMNRQAVQEWLAEFPEARQVLEALRDRLGPDDTPTPPSGGATGGQTACDHAYLPLRVGAIWTYATPTGTAVWTIESVTGDATAATAVMTYDLGDVQGVYNWQCSAAGLVSDDFGLVDVAGLGQLAAAPVTVSSGVWLPSADLLTVGYAWTSSFERDFSMAAPGTGATSGHLAVAIQSELVSLEPVTVGDQARPGLQIRQDRQQTMQLTVGNVTTPGSTFALEVNLVFAQGVGIVSTAEAGGGYQLISYDIPAGR